VAEGDAQTWDCGERSVAMPREPNRSFKSDKGKYEFHPPGVHGSAHQVPLGRDAHKKQVAGYLSVMTDFTSFSYGK
jgi:hypothetical protein